MTGVHRRRLAIKKKTVKMLNHFLLPEMGLQKYISVITVYMYIKGTWPKYS